MIIKWLIVHSWEWVSRIDSCIDGCKNGFGHCDTKTLLRCCFWRWEHWYFKKDRLTVCKTTWCLVVVHRSCLCFKCKILLPILFIFSIAQLMDIKKWASPVQKILATFRFGEKNEEDVTYWFHTSSFCPKFNYLHHIQEDWPTLLQHVEHTSHMSRRYHPKIMWLAPHLINKIYLAYK